jgi:hypothetical protein
MYSDPPIAQIDVFKRTLMFKLKLGPKYIPAAHSGEVHDSDKLRTGNGPVDPGCRSWQPARSNQMLYQAFGFR